MTSPLDRLRLSRRTRPDRTPDPAAVRRPSLEVADIFHRHGAAWRAAHAGHLSLGQLKVMSAIETCRTAALGGHVEACEDCGHSRIAYNSCRNRHCPKCQGAAARDWLAEREADLLPVGYFHVVFTLPAEIADIACQNKARGLRPAVPAASETHAHDRRRSQAPRRPHRHHRRAPHLGLGDDPPSACPHDRAGRRHLARRHALGALPARLLPAGARALEAVPPALPRRGSPTPMPPAGCSSSAIMPASAERRAFAAFWRRCARRTGSSTPSRPSPDPRPCWPICRATPTASPSPTAA